MKNSIFIWLILCFAFVSCFNTNKNKRIGDLIIKKIDMFFDDNGYLPGSVYFNGSVADFLNYNFNSEDTTEIGVSVLEIDGEVFWYEILDNESYMVGFGTALGEGVYYYSDTKEWKDSRLL